MKSTLLISFFLVLSLTIVFGQEEQRAVEDFAETLEEAEVEDNAIFEDIEYLLAHPLNINKLKGEDLQKLPFLSQIQVDAIIAYRDQVGSISSILEFQAIEVLDIDVILQLEPFLTFSKGLDDQRTSLLSQIKESKHQLYTRFERTIQDKSGYLQEDPERGYPGDPNRYYLRYRMYYDNIFSFGLTAEKDPGENFFKAENKNGFDFYSGHLAFSKINKNIQKVVVGDYRLSIGQGLVQSIGFGGRKSSLVTDIKKRNTFLSEYRSVGEFDFLRGVSADLRFNRFRVIPFVSYKSEDGTRILDDNDEDILGVTRLQNSGLHRTVSEIASKGIVNRLTTGGYVEYDYKGLTLGATIKNESFDKVFGEKAQPYQQFDFLGKSLTSTSLSYAYILKNVHFFGEAAYSNNLAMIHGVSVGLDSKVQGTLSYRNYQKDYWSFNANAFREGTLPQNETGIYLGLKVVPNKHWELSTYYDTWTYPWLRFQVDAPSKGYEWLGRLTYKQKRKFSTYVQYRYEAKQRNTQVDEDLPLPFLVDGVKQNFRIHLVNDVTKEWSLRNRLEYIHYELDETPSSGYYLYQDVIFSPKDYPFKLSARVGYFDTDNTVNTRVYTYENDILLSFSIPSYGGEGMRFYTNVRYSGIENLTLEGRIAITKYVDRTEISSGNEQIEGDTKTDVKLQIKWDF